ncbi:MAG: hypothetical protein JWR10_3409 [Rubritepida sp.]|nr:hypothetical protein [Rubritepida sp.]
MSAPHVLPTLQGVELPGYIAMGRHAAALIGDLDAFLLSPFSKVVEQLRLRIEGEVSIAEGLFANFERAEAEEVARQFPRLVEPSHEAPAATAVGTSAGGALQRLKAKRREPLVKRAPGSHRGPYPAVWTAERKQLFCELWPTEMPMDIVLQQINALEGIPCSGVNALKQQGIKRKLEREGRSIPARFRAVEVERQPPPEPVSRPATTAQRAPILLANQPPSEEDRVAGRAMILNGKGAKDLIEEFDWPERYAQEFARAVRAEKAAA